MTVVAMLLQLIPGLRAVVAAFNVFLAWFTPRKALFGALLTTLTAYQTKTISGPQAIAAALTTLAIILGFMPPAPAAN